MKLQGPKGPTRLAKPLRQVSFLDPYFRLSDIESHPVNLPDQVFVAHAHIQTSHIFSPVPVPNNAVYNKGIEPAAHCVRQPCVPEVVDAGAADAADEKNYE